MKFAGSLSGADKEKALYGVIGVPFDGNAYKKGAREGPKAIRRASQQLETFLWHEKLELSDLRYYDYGDLKLDRNAFVEEGSIEEFDPARKKVFIGGDHSISYPLVKYLFEHAAVAKVIAIDAHADFRDSYKRKKFSNACVMRKIAELIGFENVLEIGIRSSSADEYKIMRDKIRVYDAEMLREKGIECVLSEIGGGEKTYLSIDIDVLDPSIAPGVENPEPCGMSLESVISLIRAIIREANVVASDVVEVNPRLDCANGITGINAARIVFEILAGYTESDNRYINRRNKL
ncbi:MAG: agmatinase [Methanophagales archaeon]|nr:agmatinase [Methanophagales archaeon]MCW3142169.1 agmatinase [Methanophagales archaeon]